MLGLGIDIVENVRIKNSLTDNFIKTILTENEIKLYNQKNKRLDFICGRFCAKEAIIKCISDYECPHMLEIEILNEKNGKPFVKYKNYNIALSISTEKNYTVAIAILKNI